MQAASQVYLSPAVGPPGQPDFLNAAVLLETSLSPSELRLRLRQIESDLGRIRGADKYAPRPIDLDLVLYDDVVLQGVELTVPDPDLLTRPYLAITVSELDPQARHPITGEALAELAHRLGGGEALSARPEIVLDPRRESLRRQD